MIAYYDREGRPLGCAWSAAIDECPKSEEGQGHEPHPFHPEFTMYGPYMCAGWPKVDLYDQPPRKPANR